MITATQEKTEAREMLDFKDKLNRQFAPIELIAEFIGMLCNKAGSEEDKHIELSFEELFTLSNALDASVENVNRLINPEFAREV